MMRSSIAAALLALAAVPGQGATVAAKAQDSQTGPTSLNPATPRPLKQLRAWDNYQPLDAWLGSMLVERFLAPPKPPMVPGGGVLDQCPVLSEWPDEVLVDAPNACTGVVAHAGNWTATGASAASGAGIMGWSVSCSPLGPSLVPVTTYSLPGGGLFGTSSPVPSMAGNSQELRDCTGYLKYTIDEKVYKVPGEADHALCEEYGSCDGVIYTQYFIKDWAGKPMAQTPFLRLFQNRFFIEDNLGKKIAEVKRVGRWSPMSQQCVHNTKKQWLISYADPQKHGSSATFSRPAERWPVAQLVTMMANRDADRMPSGLVAPSACEVEKTGLLIFILCFAAAVIVGGVLLCMRMGVVSLQTFFIEFEQSICPKRMAKPSRPGWL